MLQRSPLEILKMPCVLCGDISKILLLPNDFANVLELGGFLRWNFLGRLSHPMDKVSFKSGLECLMNYHGVFFASAYSCNVIPVFVQVVAMV